MLKNYAAPLVLIAGASVVACFTDNTAAETTSKTATALHDNHGNGGNDGSDGVKPIANLQQFHNADGVAATYSTRDGDYLDTNNPFFDPSLGTNGRACVTCHGAENNFGLSAESVRARFERSGGTDPLFRLNDGANSPTQDVSTLDAKRQAYSLLLKFGVIRIQIKPPPTAQFTVEVAYDPYGNDITQGVSVYRRPLPSTNLTFVGGPSGQANGGFVMWDDREPDLKTQALHAIQGHAASAADPSDAVLQQIVDFESALFTAQVVGHGTGDLTDGANGGPVFLASQPFYRNINRDMPQVTNGSQVCDPARPPQLGCAAFAILNNDVFTLYNAWESEGSPHRQQVARGQKLFNEHVFTDPRIGIPQGPASVTCSGCHQAPNSGSMSGALATRPFGAVANLRVSEFAFRQPEYPVYTLRNKANGQVIVQTTDPGKALITGLIRDIDRVKIPTLRGLAARAPYFHNGAATTLDDVIDTYNRDFNANFTADEKADLVAFLKTL